MSIRGQAVLAKMTSPGAKLTALACHLTEKVKQTEELTYLYTNIDYYALSNLLFLDIYSINQIYFNPNVCRPGPSLIKLFLSVIYGFL